MHKVVIIVGPTASGKSGLAVELAKEFNGEVISADSRQVYTGLNIGTGKVTKWEMGGIRHHLLDVISPKRTFTAADYVQHATRAIEQVARRGKVPIIAGGTGFYIDALVGRISMPEVAPDPLLREELSKLSADSLLQILRKLDPARAASIEPEHPRRIIRAIEITRALGKVPPPSNQIAKYDSLWIGIAPSLEDLQQRIHRRLLERIRKGMIAEARRLHAAGLSWKRMEELGLEYRSLARHLKGEISQQQMIEELSRDIFKYAKRQITYWKRNREIQWFEPKETETIVTLVEKFIDGGR